jgi:thiol-disulfide isomerase/thioredoxin
MALVTWAFVSLILLIVIALLLLKVTRGTTVAPSPPVAPAPGAVVRAVTTIPDTVFDAVGAPDPTAPGPVALVGQPPLTLAGRPAVVYVGAEFCPYCAAERWALVAALGRFGTFTHLGATASSANEVFPSSPTFTFDGASYRSPYLTLAALEEYGPAPASTAPAGYPRLHDPTPLEWALVHRFDTEPFVAGNGTFPFVDLGNRYVVSGAGVGFSPGVLQGTSMTQIAADLADPTTPVTKAIGGEANVLSAAICQLTGNRPGPVCSSPGVRAGAHWLGAG